MFLTADPELAAITARMDNTMELLALVCFGYAFFIIIRAIVRLIRKILHK